MTMAPFTIENPVPRSIRLRGSAVAERGPWHSRDDKMESVGDWVAHLAIGARVEVVWIRVLLDGKVDLVDADPDGDIQLAPNEKAVLATDAFDGVAWEVVGGAGGSR